METGVDFISFDAGGTLLRPYPSVGQIYSDVAARYGCEACPDAIERRFREVWHRRDAMTGLVSHSSEKIEKQFWSDIVREVFQGFDPIERFDHFFEELYQLFAGPACWRLFPETLEVLEELRRRGTRLCVISNWDSRLLRLCEGLEIHGHFEFILISAVFGASKPSRKIFEEAVRLAGVPASRMLHVGDSLEDDIGGAKAAGLQAVLVDRSGRTGKETANIHPARVISDLRGLFDCL